MFNLWLIGAFAVAGQSTPTIGEDLSRRLGDAIGRHAGATAVSDCPDIGRSLRGGSGPLTCGCPAIDREMLGTSVWGNQVYTDDSNICLAAIHDGRVTTSGGRVTVWWAPGQARYTSATRNGITSWDYQDFDGSIRFSAPDGRRLSEARPLPAEKRIPAPAGKSVPAPARDDYREATLVDHDAPIATRAYSAITDCPDTGRSLRGSRTPLTCGCPAIAREMLGTSVWGNGVYTDDSNICLAAIHDGRVSLSGGRITVWARPGRAFYQSSTRNGITSIEYRDFAGSITFKRPPASRR